MSMHVLKRNGNKEELNFDKILERIKKLTKQPYPLNNVNSHIITQYVIQGLVDGIQTNEIDKHSADISSSLSIKHYEYGILAGRILISNHHKCTLESFKEKMYKLNQNKDFFGTPNPIISDEFYNFVEQNQQEIEKRIDYNRDYYFNFFSFKTLERSYLLRIDDEIIERIQDLFMRVAIFVHMNEEGEGVVNNVNNVNNIKNLSLIFETYDLLSKKYYTHATPTLFNSGLKVPSVLSCFILGTEDSIEGIMKTNTDCAKISKNCGGIGIHITNWRSRGSLIRGTGGKSNGIVNPSRILNDIARTFNQGGRRMGSFAIYLEPHHPDIFEFLELLKNQGDENLRARDLFLGLWISDLFMKRVKKNEIWSLFDPDECPGLQDVYGDEYEQLYLKYEKEDKAKKVVKSEDVWKAIYNSQKESGMPYMCYKDTVNKHSNQKNIGIIKSSNLCTEIMEVSTSKEYACCTLSSVSLSTFVEDSFDEFGERELNHEFPKNPIFNYNKFIKVIQIMTRNLNKLIDKNHYPVPETKISNIKHRPIAMGVQGLADVFFKFSISFDSFEAKILNKYIFETMYYAALTESAKMSREIYLNYKDICQKKGIVKIPKHYYLENNGDIQVQYIEYKDPKDIPTTIGSYSTFEGSPISKGIFHFEMYGLTANDLSTSFDWESLRSLILKFGVRNSLLIALMPTASTSQIFGNVEAIEPLTSNIFTRRTLAGDNIVINKYLMHDLNELGLWNEEVENLIKEHNGSIQEINLPNNLKNIYKTVWEISQKALIDLAADRQPFVDQSQSLNLFLENFSYKQFTSMHFYSWKKGLKTGSYYLRTRPAVTMQKFTVFLKKSNNNIINKPDITCLSCSG